MADPFSEFEHVEEGKANDQEVLIVVDDIDKTDHLATQAVNASFEEIEAIFSADFRPQAKLDFEKRKKYESKVNQKIASIHAIMNRLYVVRHDATSDLKKVVHDTKNLLDELNKLNVELSELRKKQMVEFGKTLCLDDLGISKNVRTASFRQSSKIDYADGKAEESDTLLSSDENFPMMRTPSTRTLQDKPPEEKWQGLFRMFREWKYQNTVANATAAISSADQMKEMVDAEKAELRAAIYRIQQRSKVTQTDKILLKIMTAKLKALNNINKE